MEENRTSVRQGRTRAAHQHFAYLANSGTQTVDLNYFRNVNCLHCVGKIVHFVIFREVISSILVRSYKVRQFQVKECHKNDT